MSAGETTVSAVKSDVHAHETGAPFVETSVSVTEYVHRAGKTTLRDSETKRHEPESAVSLRQTAAFIAETKVGVEQGSASRR